MIWRGATAFAGSALRLAAPFAGEDLSERLALTGPEVVPGGIWLHAASVGELNSARVLIELLGTELPLTVTTNSRTGRALARKLGYSALLAPLDVPQAVERFLSRVEPSVLVTVENELWPNRSAQADARGVRQVVVGARISARSAGRWAKLPALIRPMLGRLSALSAQDVGSEERLLQLGLRPEALCPRLNLKLLGPARIEPVPPGPERALTLLAASTHEGEEELILDAYAEARKAEPRLRLILAPRHPERGDAVAALIRARGLAFARRSAGGDRDAMVLLADTLGEMADWYAASGICVTCGSFGGRGGHTPWEPAAWRCAILHGPDVANHAADYADLDAAGASLPTDSAGLGQQLAALAGDPARQARMGKIAREQLLAHAGDPGPLVRRILDLARGKLV